MDFLFYGFAFVGLLTVVVMVATVAFERFDEWRAAYYRHREYARDIAADERARQRLHNQAYWFSEDVPTMQLLQQLADRRSVDDVRADWQEARKKQQDELAARVRFSAACPAPVQDPVKY